MADERRKCPDDGTCHHECGDRGCFRVACCEPLSNVFPNDEWPQPIWEAEAIKTEQARVAEAERPAHHPV